jgi:hypothetical protein
MSERSEPTVEVEAHVEREHRVIGGKQDPVDFAHDPHLAHPPQPPREVMVWAWGFMLEKETPEQRFIRQRWETTLSAVKVATDAWREVYPSHLPHMGEEESQRQAGPISEALEHLYLALDHLSKEMLGEVMHEATMGRLTPVDIKKMEGMGLR